MRRPLVRRVAAVVACLAAVVAPILALVLAVENVVAVIVVTVGTAAAAALAWIAVTRRGPLRIVAAGLAVVALTGVGIGFFAVFARNQALRDLAAVIAVLAVGEIAARIALGPQAADLRLPAARPDTVAPQPRHAVLLMNPRSDFSVLPRALTVRVARTAPGASPVPKFDHATIGALVKLAARGVPE